MCVCVCVCERERERESVPVHMWVQGRVRDAARYALLGCALL